MPLFLRMRRLSHFAPPEARRLLRLLLVRFSQVPAHPVVVRLLRGRGYLSQVLVTWLSQ